MNFDEKLTAKNGFPSNPTFSTEMDSAVDARNVLILIDVTFYCGAKIV